MILLTLSVSVFAEQALALDNSTFSLKKECEKGNGEACLKLAKSYAREKKDIQALYYFDKACSLRIAKACGLVGVYYKLGLPIKKNYKLAYEYFQRVLENSNGKLKGAAYYELGDMYKDGLYVKRDLFKAFSLYKLSCEYKFPSGCVKVGDFYKEGIAVKLDYDKALLYYGEACDMKDEGGCKKYAYLKKILLKLKAGGKFH